VPLHSRNTNTMWLITRAAALASELLEFLRRSGLYQIKEGHYTERF
jgi:hypothetical protein